MDAHEPRDRVPGDAASAGEDARANPQPPRGWSGGWSFRIDGADAPRVVPVDAATVATARAAGRAMQVALLEAQRQSRLLDDAIAALVAQGASANQIAGDAGLSLHTAQDAVAGMPILESVCRDGVAEADGAPRRGGPSRG